MADAERLLDEQIGCPAGSSVTASFGPMSTALASGNPAFNEKIRTQYLVRGQDATMTVAGTALKTLFLLVVLVAAGWWGWTSSVKSVPSPSGGYGSTTVVLPAGLWLASFAALGFGIACSLNPRRAAFLGFLYAICEGYVLGAVSAAFDAQTEGAVAAAVLGTACVFLAALVLYATRLVRPTAKMAFGVTAGIAGICLLYLVLWIFALFGWQFRYSHAFGSLAVTVSIISIILAALSFTLDFGSIEAGVEAGAPKFMESYGAFGLTVTLVWLYITLLRLIALLGGRG
jgi:uncharacterized YccA/Bax inhibitor family protein